MLSALRCFDRIRGHQARKALTRHLLKKKSGRIASRRELSPIQQLNHDELSRFHAEKLDDNDSGFS